MVAGDRSSRQTRGASVRLKSKKKIHSVAAAIKVESAKLTAKKKGPYIRTAYALLRP
jgi:hypothetical protein